MTFWFIFGNWNCENIVVVVFDVGVVGINGGADMSSFIGDRMQWKGADCIEGSVLESEGGGIGAGSAQSEELWVLKLGGEGIGAGSAQIVELLEEVESILLLSEAYREGDGEGSSAGACHGMLYVCKGDPYLILSVSPQLSSVSLLR